MSYYKKIEKNYSKKHIINIIMKAVQKKQLNIIKKKIKIKKRLKRKKETSYKHVRRWKERNRRKE